MKANSNNLPTIDRWKDLIREYHIVENVTIQDDHLDILIRNCGSIIRISYDEINSYLLNENWDFINVIKNLLIRQGVIKHYKKTLLAFFDIHAYSPFIKKSTTEDAVLKVNEFMRIIRIKSKTDIYSVKFDFMVLSDSIILVVDTTRSPIFAGSLEMLLATSSSIMKESIKLGLPLRGAIGGGDYYSDGEMLISTALVDAASFEKRQDWLGVVLTPTALQLIEDASQNPPRNDPVNLIDLNSSRYSNFIKFGKIPWKKGKQMHEDDNLPDSTYFIMPFQMHEEDWANYLPEYFKDPEKIKNSHIIYGKN